MKSLNRAIIFLQLLKNENSFRFNVPYLQKIEHTYGQEYTIFSLDNFSDTTTTHYARKLLKESEQTVIICEVEEAESLGAIGSLLNEAVKEKQKIRFFVTKVTEVLLPFQKALNGELFDENKDLKL